MRIWIGWVVSTLLYIALNVVALMFGSGIPGMASMIGWGALMPLFMTIGWWVVAISNQGDIPKWRLLGILATAVFAIAGIATLHHIGGIWASSK